MSEKNRILSTVESPAKRPWFLAKITIIARVWAIVTLAVMWAAGITTVQLNDIKTVYIGWYLIAASALISILEILWVIDKSACCSNICEQSAIVMPHSLFSDKCFWKIYPAAYEGPVGGHYNRPCPVELFQARGPEPTFKTYFRQEKEDNDIQIAMGYVIKENVEDQIKVTTHQIDNHEYQPKQKTGNKSGIFHRVTKGLRRMKNGMTGKTEVKKLK